MPLAPGTRFGPYELLALEGAGGMGEVYRARDTRLDRDVALKIIAPGLAADPKRRQRFDREARAISSLTHPHICALYDVGHENGVDYLVMEYIEGVTLAQRLLSGPLPSGEALRYAADIANALDHAHRRGLIHRDLKPGNVMLTERGATLLDFGVAKMEQNPITAGSAATATATATITVEGTLLGTFRYMAPEQIEGGSVDARADLFALGAVLYEMLTGRPAFDGQSTASIIAAVLEREPSPVPSDLAVPPMVDGLLRKCLAKKPGDRWQSAADLRFALQWGGRATTLDEPRGRSLARKSPSRLRTLMWTAAVVGAAAAGVSIGRIASRPPSPEQALVQFTMGPPDGMTFHTSGASMAVSPNGRYIAFVATSPSSDDLLWIRPLDELVPFPLSGTNGATQPFWSPDSRFVAFIAGKNLKKIDIVARSLPTTICEVEKAALAGTWNPDGTILLPSDRTLGIARVSDNGGPLALVTNLDRSNGEISHAWPIFLPDGHHFLFTIKSDRPERAGVYVGSLEHTPPIRLTSAFSNAIYAAGQLFFARDGILVAQPFNPVSLQLSGTEARLAVGVTQNSLTGKTAFSVSETGLLVFRPVVDTQLVWFDRDGRKLEPLTTPGHYENPALSPDGRKVAVELLDPKLGTPDIWLIDANTGKSVNFTEDPSLDGYPVWSSDSTRVAFASRRDGPFHIFQRPADLSSRAKVVTPSIDGIPDDWSHDGLVATAYDPAAKKYQLWTLTLGSTQPRPLVRIAASSGSPRLSPDGRWIAIAYMSEDRGQYEVFVHSVENPDLKWQVSTGGGREPQWRATDGRALYYLREDQRLIAVQVRSDPSFEFGPETVLFQAPLPATAATVGRNRYSPSRDGQRFLLNTPADRVMPLNVVVNWSVLLTR